VYNSCWQGILLHFSHQPPGSILRSIDYLLLQPRSAHNSIQHHVSMKCLCIRDPTLLLGRTSAWVVNRSEWPMIRLTVEGAPKLQLSAATSWNPHLGSMRSEAQWILETPLSNGRLVTAYVGRTRHADFSAIHCRGNALRQVSCYTLLGRCQPSWPLSCYHQCTTPFLGSG